MVQNVSIETLNGRPASILGLAGSQGMDTSCAAIAFEAGVNYFFCLAVNSLQQQCSSFFPKTSARLSLLQFLTPYQLTSPISHPAHSNGYRHKSSGCSN
jgi:hypothetical protein